MEIKKGLFFMVGIVVFVCSILSCNPPIKKEDNNPMEDRNVTFSPVPDSIEIESLVPIELRSKNAIEVFSPKAGKLIKGDVVLKNGRYVRKGELLVQLSFEEEYHQLVAIKKQLSVEVNELLEFPFIAASPNLRVKWRTFADQLNPSKRLPAFPLIDSDEEKRELKQTIVGKLYVQASALEGSIEQAFIFSPATGWLKEVKFEMGVEVLSGQLITEIVKDKQWQLKNYSIVEKLNGNDWRIVTSTNKQLGKLRRSVNVAKSFVVQLTPGIDLPMDMHCFVVSKNSIRAHRIPKICWNGKAVQCAQNGKTKRIPVGLVKQSADSVWISRLPEKCQLIPY